jgi:hypothetical protein
LNVACRSYHKALSKRKECEVLEVGSGAKEWLPIDALGMVMIAHGEEFGDDSAFGEFVLSLLFGSASSEGACQDHALPS